MHRAGIRFASVVGETTRAFLSKLFRASGLVPSPRLRSLCIRRFVVQCVSGAAKTVDRQLGCATNHFHSRV